MVLHFRLKRYKSVIFTWVLHDLHKGEMSLLTIRAMKMGKASLRQHIC